MQCWLGRWGISSPFSAARSSKDLRSIKIDNEREMFFVAQYHRRSGHRRSSTHAGRDPTNVHEFEKPSVLAENFGPAMM